MFDTSLKYRKRLRAIPIVHGSLECTRLVRLEFLNHPPDRLLIELPRCLHSLLDQALPALEQEIPVLSIRVDLVDPTIDELHFIWEPLEPLVEAIRSAMELDIPIVPIDLPPTQNIGFLPFPVPDTYAIDSMGLKAYYRKYRSHNPIMPVHKDEPLWRNSDRKREEYMGVRLLNALSLWPDENLLLVCGIRHQLAIVANYYFHKYHPDLLENRDPMADLMSADLEPPKVFRWSSLARESMHVLEQPAYYNTAWQIARRKKQSTATFNRIDLQRSVFREAVESYEKRTQGNFPRQREKLFFRFLRNWSLLRGNLLPNAYQIIVAARSFGDDFFARLVYDLLNFYPPLESPHFPEQKLELEDLYKNSQVIRLRHKLRQRRIGSTDQIQKKFQREKFPGEWGSNFHAMGTCSYPPEDLVLEEYGQQLQIKANTRAHSQVETSTPFTSSMLDGLDYRETMRQNHMGRIYVKELRRSVGEAGSVVVIYSNEFNIYPWRMVWWGEHAQESDMVFYATPPGQEYAGPGIARCRYGGYALLYPPGRLHEVWQDPRYTSLQNPTEVLLLAAIEYNEKRLVVYVGHEPPPARMQSLAGRLGQRIVFIPFSSLNQQKLRRIQRFHVLDHHDRRDAADEFIW